MVKRVIYVPMVHDPWTEYPEALLKDTIGPNPNEALIRKFRDGLRGYWDKVDTRLASESVQRVYQDSCYDFFGLEHYLKRYREDSDKSRNFSAICSLLENGAQLMITESNNAKNEGYFEEDPEKQRAPRDRYIASNIDHTLQEGETGVLFMGINHKVDQIMRAQYPAINVANLNGEIRHLLDLFETLRADYQGSKAQPN
jgi:hypothetical protein